MIEGCSIQGVMAIKIGRYGLSKTERKADASANLNYNLHFKN
jgi:hypothetical protein